MQELENIQPEERLEGSESVESVEEQELQEATHEPGARVEETQGYEQAEEVEGALTEAMAALEVEGQVVRDEVTEAAREEGGTAIAEAPEAIRESEAVSAEEVRANLSEEQLEALSALPPKDQEELLRVVGKSQRILPNQLPGHSGGFVY